MSFFNIKEAIEEYIEEYALQEQIAKADFGFEIYINNNNLIIKLHYDMDWDSDEDDRDFQKEFEMYKYNYDIALSHYNEDALNQFLDDTLLSVLPTLENKNSEDGNKFLLFFRKTFILSNGEKFRPDDKKIYNTISSVMPTHSHSLASSTTDSLYPVRDDRHLWFKVLKNRTTNSNDNQRLYWNLEWEGLNGDPLDYGKDIKALLASSIAEGPKAIYYQHTNSLCPEIESPLARQYLPDIISDSKSHVITLDSIVQP